jgi:hypothetical protein
LQLPRARLAPALCLLASKAIALGDHCWPTTPIPIQVWSLRPCITSSRAFMNT